MRYLIKRLLTAAYVLLIVLFLAGYLARYLPSGLFWWTGIFGAFVPYTSLAILLIAPFMLAGSPGHWRWIHVLLIVLVGVRFISLERVVGLSEPRETDLTVMSYNSPVRGPSPEALSEATLRLLNRQKPDLLALQEPVIKFRRRSPKIEATPHVQVLIDSLDYRPPDFSQNGKNTLLRQPVLTRFPVQDIQAIELPRSPDTEHASIVTRLQFRWKGRDAVFYNVHLHTVSPDKPWEEEDLHLTNPYFWQPYLESYRTAYRHRTDQVRFLRELLEQETLPVIVTGDLNSTIHNWEYEHLARGLNNAFTLRGKGWGGTYHARLPLVRIDHILVSPDWEVTAAHVPDEYAYSDHRPVVAHLRWRDP